MNYEIRHAARRAPQIIHLRATRLPLPTASHFGHHHSTHHVSCEASYSDSKSISAITRYSPCSTSVPCDPSHNQTHHPRAAIPHGTRNTLPRRPPTEPRLPLHPRPAAGAIPPAAPCRAPVRQEEEPAGRGGSETATGRDARVVDDQEGPEAEDADADRLCVVAASDRDDDDTKSICVSVFCLGSLLIVDDAGVAPRGRL